MRRYDQRLPSVVRAVSLMLLLVLVGGCDSTDDGGEVRAGPVADSGLALCACCGCWRDYELDLTYGTCRDGFECALRNSTGICLPSSGPDGVDRNYLCNGPARCGSPPCPTGEP